MLGNHSRMCFGISLGILVVAVVMVVWGAPLLINRQIQKNIQIDNSSLMFEKWRKLPIPLDFKINVFNVTNPDEVNDGEKPKLKEIGPYVYKEYREKTILGYGTNDTIKYMLKKSFFFDAGASGALKEDDEVTIINFSYLAAIHSVNDLMPSMVGMINEALGEFFTNLTDPFLRVKVKDLFFDGVYLNCVGNHSALNLICGKIKSDNPPTMKPTEDGNGFMFSMFGHLNTTESGPFEMVRGTQNIYELGHIVSYKGKTKMSTWGNKYCDQINGSDSSIFPPIDESRVPQRIYSFEPDICRSLYVTLVEKTSLFGLNAYYYEMDSSALAAKSANPNNKCFCKRNWSGNHDGCLLMGIMNLNPCQGAPAIASLPHFYLASEELLEYFDEGVQPDKEKHKTFVYLDPVTGVVMKGLKRLQFNIELRQLPLVPQLSKVRTGLFPLLWIEEGAEINQEIKDELQQSHSLISHVSVVPWILFALAFIAVIGSSVAVIKSGGIPLWPRNNSVSFILRPAGNDVNKVQ